MKKIILSCLLSGVCFSAFSSPAMDYNRGLNQEQVMTYSAIRDCNFEINGSYEDVGTDPYEMKDCLQQKHVDLRNYHGTPSTYDNNPDGQTFIQYEDDEHPTYLATEVTAPEQKKKRYDSYPTPPDAWPN